MSFRFTSALVLLIVCLATPVWAGFQAGLDAANRGDYAIALSEWRPLAERGVAQAKVKLGGLYFSGQGVSQDYVQARQWYEKAAAQGDARAQYNLGVLYGKGLGVPQDDVRAYMWYSLAMGHSMGPSIHKVQKLAADNRDVVARRMTPSQIAEAQKLAREWKPKER
jgi:uncharacterized protein